MTALGSADPIKTVKNQGQAFADVIVGRFDLDELGDVAAEQFLSDGICRAFRRTA
jgi:hypothetical protein